MGRWAAFWGPGAEETLKALLGGQARTHIGQGFGFAVRNDGGEPARLLVGPSGAVTVALGAHPDAGSSATVDPAGPTLTLRRDPFGCHSLYAVAVGGVLWCASDVRLLRRLPGVANQVDPLALHGYLCFSYVPVPLALTAGITALPPGEQILIKSGKWCQENTATWRQAETVGLTQDEAVVELRRRLRAAVARRVGAEREVGLFLSGGIDSSFVAALLVEAGVKVHLFSLDFGPPFDVELPYARQVAAHLKQPLHVVAARPQQIKAALVATASALQQPFGDGVTVPLFLLGQAAADWVRIVFNGEGGDQVFGGWANKPMIAAEVYAGESYDRLAAYLGTYRRFLGLADQLYTPEARAALGKIEEGDWIRPALTSEGFASLIHRLRAANLWLKGAQNIAPRASQLAEAHNLSVQAPFCDRALVEWTFGLPPEWLLQGACEKYLLKRAAEPYLPAPVVWREKRGMGVPTTDWCLGPLRGEVKRWLGPRRLKREGWFAPAFVQTLCRGEGQPDEYRRRRVGEKLWTLLLLQVWREAQSPPLDLPLAAPSLREDPTAGRRVLGWKLL